MANNDAVVYQLATEEVIQNMAAGTRIPDGYDFWAPTSLQRVFRANYQVVASPFGGNGIRVSNRGNDAWQGIDLKVGGSLGFSGVTLSDAEYTVRIRGNIRGNATIQLAGGDSPQSGFFSEAVNGDFSIEHTFTLEGVRANGVHTRGIIRINTTDSTADFEIHEIVIARGTSIPAGIGEAVATVENNDDDNATTTPAAVSAGLATWQDVLDTGIFTAIRGHNTGNPSLDATADALVLSGRNQDAPHGEHDGLGIHLTQLRALGEGRNPEIVISGTIGGTAAENRMFAQLFDGGPNRRDDDWTRAYVDPNDGTFTMTITNEPMGVPTWAGDWASRPWIGAHPRGDMTITSITIGGVSILEILGDGDVVIEDDPVLDLGFTAPLFYSLIGDPMVQALDRGVNMPFSDLPHLGSSGGGGITTVVGNPLGGGNAVYFSGRNNEWDGLDIMWGELGLADGVYTIRAVGNIELVGAFDPASVAIAGSANPWGWIGLEEFPDEETGDFEMVRTFTVNGTNIIDDENGNMGGNLRIRPMDVLNNFTIYEVTIVSGGEANLPALPARVAVDPTTPVAPPVPTDGVLIQLVIGNINASVNGVTSVLDAEPFIGEGGRTMVPLRFVADAMGAATGWDGATRTVTVTPAGGSAVELVIDQPLADGMGTPVIVNERTFVPVRFVVDAMGGVIDWNQATQTVTITLGEAEEAVHTPIPGGGTLMGISVDNVVDGSSVTGANVIIGSGINEWPFADGPGGEDRAFEPEQGATYRISFNVTNDGSGGWRVRWGRGTGLFGDARYTTADYAVVNGHPVSPNDVATVVPAHFNQNVSADGTYTLVVDVTLDGSEVYDGLIGNIVLTGTAGSHDFVVNWVTVEQDGETLASWER
jgi:hypothetical protein